MFLKVAKNLKNSNFPKLASGFHTSIPSQYTLSKATIDFSLLSPFDKSKTFQALNQVHQATVTQKGAFNPFDIKILDKTGSTSYSQTFRAYDRESHVLFAQKKLFLDSGSSWNQLNLILKQYAVQSPHLASIYSINFDERNQEVNVMSQVNKNTIGDSSQFMAKQDIKMADELLMSYTQQILSQLKAMRLMNAHCEASIQPQNMFIDDKSHNLKLFDFSDFHIGAESLERESRQDNMFLNIALQTLVQTLNPDVHVSSIEEARMYLSRSYPSFYKIIKDDLISASDIKNHPLHTSSDYDAFISEKLRLFDNSSRVANETKNSFEKDQEEGLEFWKQFKENIETGYLKQVDAHNFLGNQKLMAEAYERLFTIKEKILKAQEEAKLNTIQEPLAREKESLAYRSTSGLLSFSAHIIQVVLGFFLFLIWTWGLIMVVICILMAGAIIYHGVQSIISPSVREENNVDQNDGKTVNKSSI